MFWVNWMDWNHHNFKMNKANTVPLDICVGAKGFDSPQIQIKALGYSTCERLLPGQLAAHKHFWPWHYHTCLSRRFPLLIR